MKYIFLIALVVLHCGIAMRNSFASPEETVGMTIDLDEAGSTRFRIDGTYCKLDQVYKLASLQNSKYGENVEYHVMFIDEIPFLQVINAKKTLQSIGFRKVRFFVFSSDRRYMTEIGFDKIYPYHNGFSKN